MIRPVTIAVTLSVIVLAFVVASAAEGRFGGGTTGPYFPQSLRQTKCEPVAADAVLYPALTAFEDDWYSGDLRAADEPSFYLTSQDHAAPPSWRFTWLRSFHAPVVVRIDTLPSGALQLTAKHLGGEGGYGPGRVDRQITRRLTAGEDRAFRAKLAETKAFAQSAFDCQVGLDGSAWILESAGPDGYRFVKRWTPSDGPVRDIGLAFLGLTGWKNDPIY